MLAAGLDITDRKNAEIQAAALREELAHLGRVTMLDALAGSLAHEINQPLTAIMANAEAALRLMAAQPPRLSELRETLNEILSDNKRASEVLRAHESAPEEGRVAARAYRRERIVSEVVKLVQGNAVDRRIALDVELAADIVPVLGDRIQIQQVVLNLLMNAFDAVQDRETADRRVRLRTSQRDLAAVIEVSDQGAGLVRRGVGAHLRAVLHDQARRPGARALDLPGIVAAHGGTLDAMRNPGTGMTFSASFPLCRPLEPDRPASPAARRLQEQR